MIETIGDRLRTFAKSNFKNMEEFAKKLEIEQSSLSAYLNNRNIPGGKILIRIRKLGCDINWLLTGEVGIDYKNLVDAKTELEIYKKKLSEISNIAFIYGSDIQKK
ncbi:MAG: helix-turn-helix domain-containing protein [Ignavibacteriaceae bacterium]